MTLLCGTAMWLSVYLKKDTPLIASLALVVTGTLLIGLGIVDLYIL